MISSQTPNWQRVPASGPFQDHFRVSSGRNMGQLAAQVLMSAPDPRPDFPRSASRQGI